MSNLELVPDVDDNGNPCESRSYSNLTEWSFGDLSQPVTNNNSLLGNRFLERGGTLGIVGPSGVGKSVVAIQMALLWAIGKPAFDIDPSSKLKLLVVQNEDSIDDVRGAFQGVIQHSAFSDEDKVTAEANLKFNKLVGRKGSQAAQEIREVLRSQSSDIVIINPLNAYTSGKPGEETDVFIREELQPMAHEFACGIMVIHHTPKIGRMNGIGQGRNEFERQYNATGRADVANALRGIINIMPAGRDVFRFTADKRGRHLGWKVDGQQTIQKHFKHNRDPENNNLVWWSEATKREAEQATAGTHYLDILKVLPKHNESPVSRSRVIELTTSQLNIGKGRTEHFLRLGVEHGRIERVEGKSELNRNTIKFRCSALTEGVE